MSEPTIPPAAPVRPRRPRRRWLVVGGIVIVAAIGAFTRFALHVHAFASRHATGPAWTFPSRVWSADLPLVPGAALPMSYLREELLARGYREATGTPARPGEWHDDGEEARIWLRTFTGIPGRERPARLVRVRIAAGRVAAVGPAGEAGAAGGPPALEPVLIGTVSDSNRVAREWVPLARIPPALQRAVIASEDRRFRSHWGLDLKGNARALATNVRAGGVRQGASTITQQLARGLFLGSQRTVGRKLLEMPLALAIERVLTKDQILEMYLNSVYFGHDEAGGFAGVAEASRRIFGLPVESLSPGQCAMLVGIIPAPNVYSPLRRPDNALRRRWVVLHDELEAGFIDSAAVVAGANEPLVLRPTGPPRERFASYMTYTKRELDRVLPHDALEGWGLSVVTACDPVWQYQAESQLAAGIDAQEGWRGRGRGPLQGAFVLLDAAGGEVRAIVGGRDPGRGDFDRASQARRQPGSAIKPIVYAAALDPRRGGERFTPGSTVPDLPRTFGRGPDAWRPKNDDGEYHETVTLTKALAKSMNLATANLVERLGAATVARYAERFGLGRPEPLPSIGLGTHEVTPLAMVDAYSVFVNGGWRREPTSVREVRDARGAVLPLPKRPRIDVLPEGTAALARGMLEDVVTFGISYPLKSEFGFTRPCGGKTGTTNDFRDAWFVGFTPDLVAGVWVGYDQPQSLAGAAARVALPIWARIMTRVLADFPPAPFPARADQSLVWIDPYTGGRARGDCPSPLRVPFENGTEPQAACTRDHSADWAEIRARATADSLSRAAADSSARADSSGTRADEF